jgi:Fe-S-cluster containining protein
MDINIKAFTRKSARNKKKYTTFLKGLHSRKVRGLTPLAKKLDKLAFKEIDCLKCANCCKTMSPTWKPADIKRASDHLKITPQAFRKKWLYKDETGDWLNTNTPCQFLGKDNKCKIYLIRPYDCKGFPHMHHTDFLVGREVNIPNMTSCPAVYNVIENMYKIVVEKDQQVLDKANHLHLKTHF